MAVRLGLGGKNIGDVSQAVDAARTSASQVLSSAHSLSQESQRPTREVDLFLKQMHEK